MLTCHIPKPDSCCSECGTPIDCEKCYQRWEYEQQEAEREQREERKRAEAEQREEEIENERIRRLTED